MLDPSMLMNTTQNPDQMRRMMLAHALMQNNGGGNGVWGGINSALQGFGNAYLMNQMNNASPVAAAASAAPLMNLFGGG